MTARGGHSHNTTRKAFAFVTTPRTVSDEVSEDQHCRVNYAVRLKCGVPPFLYYSDVATWSNSRFERALAKWCSLACFD